MPVEMVVPSVPLVGRATTMTGFRPSAPVSLEMMFIVPGPPPARQTLSALATGALAPRTLKTGSGELSTRVDVEYVQGPVSQPVPFQVTRVTIRYIVVVPPGTAPDRMHASRAAVRTQVPM